MMIIISSLRSCFFVLITMGAGGSISLPPEEARNAVIFLKAGELPSKAVEDAFEAKTFLVSLIEEVPRLSPAQLPRTFLLRIGVESLDFVSDDEESRLLAQFPFQTVASWGSNSQAFKIAVFDYDGKQPGAKDPKELAIILKTFKGRAIEECTVAAVRRLMNAMEAYTLKKIDFDEMLLSIIDPSTNGLIEEWKRIITEYTENDLLSSKQAMDVMVTLSPYCTPFELTDLACLLYAKILHRDAFQLVINTFQDARDRENLEHLLTRQETMTSGVFYNAASDKRASKGADHRAKKSFPFQTGCFMLMHSVVGVGVGVGAGAGGGGGNGGDGEARAEGGGGMREGPVGWADGKSGADGFGPAAAKSDDR